MCTNYEVTAIIEYAVVRRIASVLLVAKTTRQVVGDTEAVIRVTHDVLVRVRVLDLTRAMGIWVYMGIYGCIDTYGYMGYSI